MTCIHAYFHFDSVFLLLGPSNCRVAQVSRFTHQQQQRQPASTQQDQQESTLSSLPLLTGSLPPSTPKPKAVHFRMVRIVFDATTDCTQRRWLRGRSCTSHAAPWWHVLASLLQLSASPPSTSSPPSLASSSMLLPYLLYGEGTLVHQLHVF